MSSSKDVVARLRTVDRFAGLSDRELKQVAETGTLLHQPANWALMSENTPADKAYVLLEGTAVIRHHGEDVATVGPGSVIGEIGILQKRLRTASVVSTTPLEVVHFTRENLEDLVAKIPALAELLQETAQAHADASADGED